MSPHYLVKTTHLMLLVGQSTTHNTSTGSYHSQPRITVEDYYKFGLKLNIADKTQ